MCKNTLSIISRGVTHIKSLLLANQERSPSESNKHFSALSQPVFYNHELA
jgi:hypothetical protein